MMKKKIFFNFFSLSLKNLSDKCYYVIIVSLLYFIGDKLDTYRDLGYLKPVTDITFHPHDNFIAFGCYVEGGHSIYIYSRDPKGTLIF